MSGDEADQADSLIEYAREQGIKAVRTQVGKEYHPLFDGQHCVDCGEEIPAPRLDAGRVRCVQCQTHKEQTAKRFNR